MSNNLNNDELIALYQRKIAMIGQPLIQNGEQYKKEAWPKLTNYTHFLARRIISYIDSDLHSLLVISSHVSRAKTHGDTLVYELADHLYETITRQISFDEWDSCIYWLAGIQKELEYGLKGEEDQSSFNENTSYQDLDFRDLLAQEPVGVSINRKNTVEAQQGEENGVVGNVYDIHFHHINGRIKEWLQSVRDAYRAPEIIAEYSRKQREDNKKAEEERLKLLEEKRRDRIRALEKKKAEEESKKKRLEQEVTRKKRLRTLAISLVSINALFGVFLAISMMMGHYAAEDVIDVFYVIMSTVFDVFAFYGNLVLVVAEALWNMLSGIMN